MEDKITKEILVELKKLNKTQSEIKLYTGIEIQLIKQLLNETRRNTWRASMAIKEAE